jgi:hypothetical protein
VIIEDNKEIFKLDEEGRVEKRFEWKRLFLPVSIVLISLLSFGIGRLTVLENNTPIRIEYDEELANDKLPTTPTTEGQMQTLNAAPAAQISNTTVVGSSKSDKYHYLHCSGAKQISEKNKITFSSPAQAESAGYTLAANCEAR